jgi:catechol 2,3-dioxygenase-like lactoylglutathione lyase family enzyme
MSSLRVEFFVQELSASQNFYKRVLGFEQLSVSEDGYTVLRLGNVRIDLQPKHHIPEEHPLYYGREERVGLGIEIVLEVDNVDEAYAVAQKTGWPLADLLQARPWGARDFRLLDPDGRYIRVTSA